MQGLKFLGLRWMLLADGGSGSEAAPPSGGDSGSVSGAPAPASPESGGDAGGTASPLPGNEGVGGEATAPAVLDWSALGSTDDLDTKIEIPTEPQAPPPAQPVQQTPPPVAPAAPTQAAQPAAAQPAPEGDSRPLSAADPWRIAEGLEANRDAVIAHLAQAKFALSEADIKDLDTDVTVAVPKLLARVFLESQVSMQKFLAQAVPGMMKQYNTVTSANDGAEKRFFEAHKALDMNNPQHRATTVRIASIYRQANPTIPLDQLIQEVGPMVMAALRVNGAAAQPGAQPSAPRGGVPFRPAVGGGGGPPTSEPVSEWAGLGKEYD
jgi:hypothetical protein